jgi:antitoxin (DNA-binding transcriptional repressor) of toxin-antitoxin stability system
MKTISVRDLRQRWPQAEALLKTEHELVITRDGQAVAKLVRIIPTKAKRTRFDPAEHARWQGRVFGKGKLIRWVDQALAQARADRRLAR